MKLFGYWTVFVALVISAAAAYYSIVGLVAIFAAAVMPIVIMGASLEVGKITTAIWLHTYWHQAQWHIKTYLSIALVLLMFITSMGIFGFLSKAHIEQTAQATEGTAQLARIEDEIARYNDVIARSEGTINKLENTNSNADAGLDDKITREQERIDTAYDRIQPAIDEQKQLLNDNLIPYDSQLKAVDERLSLYNQYVSEGNIPDIQRLVGTSPDGQYGPGTKSAVDAWLTAQNTLRDDTLSQVQELRNANAKEIQRLRSIAESEIADSNKLISRLREQVGRDDNAQQILLDIDTQRARIKEANVEVDKLFESKYAIERETRLLEAEVGPVKYIAEFVYGDQADSNTLEQAVRWVILILVIVFDPLAVALIIAGITLIENAKPKTRRETLTKKTEEPLEEPQVELKAPTDDITQDIIKNTDINILDVDESRLSTVNDSVVSEDPVLSDANGEYIIDKHTGKRKYLIDQYQYELNSKARQRKNFDIIIERMKKDGYWPTVGEKNQERKIMNMLANADQTTLDEVYKEITTDLNQKKEI